MSSHLPAEASSFVGRATEIRASRELLSSSRLVTLTGCGGIGKTRLALRMARDARNAFPGGVWFVDFAPVPPTADAILVEQIVAQTLGLIDFSDAGARSALIGHLRHRYCLLVLDNCEHLVEQVGTLVSQLLRGVDGLRVLATSREMLRCAGERVVAMQPLTVHATDGHVSDAVELLRQRAASVGAPLSEEDITPATELCRRLDGLPLAIELAASRLTVLTVAEILTRLDDRFRLLTGGVVHENPGQQALLDVMDWSYQLCTVPQRLLWARLAVFPAGFDLDAAEHVCSGEGIDAAELLDVLAGLVRQSVLIAERDGPRTRYRQLDTLRDYGRALLADSGQVDLYQLRHQAYFRKQAAEAENEWFSARQPYWLSWASTNMQNLRAAMERALAGPCPDHALEIAVSLNTLRVWFFIGWPSEGRAWLERALAAVPGTTHPLRGKALALAGLTALATHDMPRAESLIDECRATTGDLPQRHDLRFLEGIHALFTGDARAVGLLGELYASVAEAGGRDLVTVGHNWAVAAATLGDLETALAVTSRHLEYTERGQAPWHVAWAQWASAIAHMRADRHELALDHARDSIRGHTRIGDLWGALLGLLSVAWTLAAALRRGEDLTGGSGRTGAETVAELLGGAARMAAWFGADSTQDSPFTSHLVQAARTARDILGDDAFQRAFAEGAHTTESREQAAEQITATALGTRPPAAGQSEPEFPVDDEAAQLTDREREIADIVAQGSTNRQIAEKLVLSTRTVQTHVANIMRKLGMHSRHEIVLWRSRREGLSPSAGSTTPPAPPDSAGGASYEALRD
ncbi:helix-turn-helix transcriptional regulator [Pseudonocardia spinosispora]|uniref:helix-turn-helix transcriptional regulator n=1 Tax=Pseudonocardia spinosispora TaxID=103441 RepID=UPI000412E318|nr:LuxR C-terminal-related transcriptional regulator [Pseudonocardia spinosispora]